MADCKTISAVSNPMIATINTVTWSNTTNETSYIIMNITVTGTPPGVLTVTVDGVTDMTPTLTTFGTFNLTTLYAYATNVSHSVCVSP